jgi:hypothetical protein
MANAGEELQSEPAQLPQLTKGRDRFHARRRAEMKTPNAGGGRDGFKVGNTAPLDVQTLETRDLARGFEQ